MKIDDDLAEAIGLVIKAKTERNRILNELAVVNDRLKRHQLNADRVIDLWIRSREGEASGNAEALDTIL